MSLELELALGRQRIVAGEDLAFRITIKNRGAADATVRDPALDAEWPKLEVLEPSGFRVAHAGRADREKDTGHEFLLEPPPERVTLAPGSEASGDEHLLRWVGPLAPGSYNARLHLDADGVALRSTPSPLEVEPLVPIGASLVGPHAGPGDMIYALVIHRESDGSASLFSWLHQMDFEGHVHVASVQRLGPVGRDAVGSVSRAGLPYPGQWIVWTEGARLRGFYHMQGRLTQRLDAALSAPATLVGPALVELEGCDGSAPPRADVLLHSAGRAFVAQIAPDGTVAEGPSWPLEGTFEWGRATLPESNLREAFVVLARETALEIVRLAWDADGRATPAVSIAKRPAARVLGGDAMLGADGAFRGAIVTREVPEAKLEDETDLYELVRFEIDASGRGAVRASGVFTDPARDFVRALVGVAVDGSALLLLQAVGGSFWTSFGGVASPTAALDGEPLAVRFWGRRATALLAVARGVAYRGLAP